MLDISYNTNIVNNVFVIMCSFCGDTSLYQKIYVLNRITYLTRRIMLHYCKVEREMMTNGDF